VRRKLTRMATVELTDAELRIVRSALKAFRDDFGHNEADVVRQIQAVLAKIPQPQPAS
jgi:hypothetical protein